MNKISVIIPTHNRPKLLKEALQSLCQQSLKPDEVIVVDDASDPPVREKILRDEFDINIRVLRNNIAHGLAWVRHQGVEASTADYVTHLDDDDLYAPETLEDSARLLERDPKLEVVFLGVEGFGDRAGYFNNVQSAAVSSIIVNGRGEVLTDNIVRFKGELLDGLLLTVPSAFQHVMARREVWNKVSALRRIVYCLDPDIHNEDEARKRITGPLRDSEWAIYAGVICRHSALINRPRYLARCEGQGMTSQPPMRERHEKQKIHIKESLFQASNHLAEFKSWRSRIRDNMSKTYFDTAYYYFYHGDRLQAWKFLKKAMLTKPMLAHAKFFLRTCFPRKIISV